MFLGYATAIQIVFSTAVPMTLARLGNLSRRHLALATSLAVAPVTCDVIGITPARQYSLFVAHQAFCCKRSIFMLALSSHVLHRLSVHFTRLRLAFPRPVSSKRSLGFDSCLVHFLTDWYLPASLLVDQHISARVHETVLSDTRDCALSEPSSSNNATPTQPDF